MPFVPAPNIAQVELRATRAQQAIENRFMVDMLTAPTAPLLSALATDILGWVEPIYTAMVDPLVHFTEMVLTDMSQLNGPQVSLDMSSFVGTLGGAPKPNQVSLCVSLRSAARGRSARGRAYLLGLAQDAFLDANTVSNGYANTVITGWQALINLLSARGTPMTIVSYRSNKVPRPGGPVYFTVEGAVLVDNIVDSQKRRKPGVGI